MLFEAIPEAKISPSVLSYNASISACQKGGQWQQALMLFYAMPKVRISPDIYSYGASISACDKGSRWQHALLLFGSMPDSTVQPNWVAYNALLACKEICGSKSLGGRIFKQGFLPILMKSGAFQDLIVDLHEQSEGAARLTLQWWLSMIVTKHLEVSDRLKCIVVTGYGKSRHAWQNSDLRATTLDFFETLELTAYIFSWKLVLQVGLSEHILDWCVYDVIWYVNVCDRLYVIYYM